MKDMLFNASIILIGTPQTAEKWKRHETMPRDFFQRKNRSLPQGAVAQLEERFVRNEEVVSSNLIGSTI